MDTFYLPNNFYHHSNWNWNSLLKWIWRHEIKGGSLINIVITWGIVYCEHQPKYQAKVPNSFAHAFVWFWSNLFLFDKFCSLEKNWGTIFEKCTLWIFFGVYFWEKLQNFQYHFFVKEPCFFFFYTFDGVREIV
jgi:hypothetical protein